MDLAELSRNTATWLLVGSLGEGMPIMLFGGFAAHRGWLALIPWVILVGAIGNAVAQGVWFFGARYAGRRILDKRADWAAKVERVDRLLEKWEAPVIIGARAIPGFSATALVTVALSEKPAPAPIRAAVCERLAWLGLELDGSANKTDGPLISTKTSNVRAWVIPTNEEIMIAQHTLALVDKR